MSSPELQPGWRSLLFVPGDNAERLAKAHTRGADAIIIDLEDGVSADAKPKARANLVSAITSLRAHGRPTLVRINAGWRNAISDVAAAVAAGADALMVPKVEDICTIKVIASLLDELEAESGVAAGNTGLIALIESPAALPALPAIAAGRRVIGLALGSEDYSLGLGVGPTRASLDLPCQLIAQAAAQRGLMALGAPVSIAEFRDLDVYRNALLDGKAYGMNGVLCIHPAQVTIANQAFSASEQELAQAELILGAWARAQDQGASVTQLNGSMIDLPVAMRARRLLSRNGSIGIRP